MKSGTIARDTRAELKHLETLGGALERVVTKIEIPQLREVLEHGVADKLTRRPGEVEKADADALHAAGWNDAAIVEAVLTVAYLNLINRVSLGLGLMADL